MGDYIQMPDGRCFSSVAVTHIFEESPNVVEAQLIQEAADLLRVRIVRDRGYLPRHTENIIRALQERIGKSMRFEFEFVQEIPREPNGKFKYFISRLPKNT
jgi:phenylacetate-coenzyme A ligase PaaK-like adenylate-forming protein